ncbi:MAG: DUF3352 domain-containing protein [Chloroflexi bacterium CFX4]|nr:DUF3352 domain-containing protein [Chloroflexi bacterium CFX4]MDL1921511.1 DUF3352 domain-containing protein [Chloroflexi bacterium CFX3]
MNTLSRKALCIALWAALCLAAAPLPNARAQTDALDVQPIAALFPPAEFFVAIRTDQAFTDQLNAISIAVSSEFAPERIQLAQLVDVLLGQGVYSLSRLVNARFAALSINGVEYLVDADPTNNAQAHLRVVIGHGLGRLGKAALPSLQALIGLTCGEAAAPQVRCAFDQAGIFNSLTIDERYIVLLSHADDPFLPSETLSAQPDFSAALNALPEGNYDGFAYINTPRFAGSIRYEGIREMLAAVGFPTDRLAAAMLGLTLKADGLQLDLVQRRLVQPDPNRAALDLNFARFIPETAAIYLQTRDFSQLTQTAAGLLGSLSATLSSQEAYISLQQLFRSLFRLDLDGDLLSWAQRSDYAVFIDALNVMDSPSIEQLEIGFIIGSSDVQKTAAVAAAIASGLERQLSGQGNFSFGSHTLPSLSAPVTRISYTDPQFGTLTFLIGNTDQFGFFATERSLTRILEGKTLDKRLDLARLQRYLLPQPNILLHADADNATRFLFAAAESLARISRAQLNSLPPANRLSEGRSQHFERAVISVDEGPEGQARLRLFLSILN